MYDETRIDWSVFAGDPVARVRVGYEAPDIIELSAKLLKIPEDDVRRRWKQLMYFFATVHLLAKTGSLLPGNKPIQPPPQLEEVWRIFREMMPEHVADYCRSFFDGQDVGWRAEYPPEHRLTPDRLELVSRTATEVIEFEVDAELWRL
ncbi:MAG TPA: hypothetical protein DEB09_02610 [Candidatus Magasanikbacteria bacterium]|nr:hypothetical protein [Candidatus Magasanikbacteria bacterium]